jgi:hypothetical protein
VSQEKFLTERVRAAEQKHAGQVRPTRSLVGMGLLAPCFACLVCLFAESLVGWCWILELGCLGGAESRALIAIVRRSGGGFHVGRRFMATVDLGARGVSLLRWPQVYVRLLSRCLLVCGPGYVWVCGAVVSGAWQECQEGAEWAWAGS